VSDISPSKHSSSIKSNRYMGGGVAAPDLTGGEQ
jgi:hypothetical protein